MMRRPRIITSLVGTLPSGCAHFSMPLNRREARYMLRYQDAPAERFGGGSRRIPLSIRGSKWLYDYKYARVDLVIATLRRDLYRWRKAWSDRTADAARRTREEGPVLAPDWARETVRAAVTVSMQRAVRLAEERPRE